MAVTSIWRVHGSVGKVLDYVENAEKTTAVSTGDGDLSDVIDYAIQQRKTSQTQVRDGEEVVQRFVSGINCNPRTAKMEMQKIKKFYLGGNEQSTHEYVSKLLGKQTIDTNTYGQSKGRSGSYTTNFQTAGRELMTPDEVRMLDNRYALLFIRGERPVKDLKYNILKHPNVALTTDGQAAAYQHGTDPLSVAAVSINLEKLKQAASEDTGTGDYVVLTEEEVYDFMRRKAQENNQNQNSNHQEETYEKHHQQYHPPHHPSYF